MNLLLSGSDIEKARTVHAARAFFFARPYSQGRFQQSAVHLQSHQQQVAQALVDYRDPVAHTRMARMHGRSRISLDDLHSDPRWEQAVAAVKGYEQSPELELDL